MKKKFLNSLNMRNKILLTIMKYFIVLVLYVGRLKSFKIKNISSPMLWWSLSKLYNMDVAWWSRKKLTTPSQWHEVDVDMDMDGRLENMICDIEESYFKKAQWWIVISGVHKFYTIVKIMMLKLFNLKGKKWVNG